MKIKIIFLFSSVFLSSECAVFAVHTQTVLAVLRRHNVSLNGGLTRLTNWVLGRGENPVLSGSTSHLPANTSSSSPSNISRSVSMPLSSIAGSSSTPFSTISLPPLGPRLSQDKGNMRPSMTTLGRKKNGLVRQRSGLSNILWIRRTSNLPEGSSSSQEPPPPHFRFESFNELVANHRPESLGAFLAVLDPTIAVHLEDRDGRPTVIGAGRVLDLFSDESEALSPEQVINRLQQELDASQSNEPITQVSLSYFSFDERSAHFIFRNFCNLQILLIYYPRHRDEFIAGYVPGMRDAANAEPLASIAQTMTLLNDLIKEGAFREDAPDLLHSIKEIYFEKFGVWIPPIFQLAYLQF